MGRLITAGIVSADGYTADASGSFAWAAPDPEVHAFVNDLERGIRTYVYGRRMFEVMRFWADVPDLEAEPDVIKDYAAVWQAADKVVFSSTLAAAEVDTARTRLETAWSADVVRMLLEQGDVSIGGPTVAASAWRDELVDEMWTMTVPYLAGGGTRFFPDGVSTRLHLVESRVFDEGTVFSRYSVGAS